MTSPITHLAHAHAVDGAQARQRAVQRFSLLVPVLWAALAGPIQGAEAPAFDAGQQALNSGQPVTAVDHFQRSIARQVEGGPAYLRDLFWLARAQYESGDIAAAERNLAIYWDIQEDLHPSMNGQGSPAYRRWLAQAYRQRFGRDYVWPAAAVATPDPAPAPVNQQPSQRPTAFTTLGPLWTAELALGGEDLGAGTNGGIAALRVGREWSAGSANRRWYAGGEWGVDGGSDEMGWLAAVGSYRFLFHVGGQQFEIGPTAAASLIGTQDDGGLGARLGAEVAWRRPIAGNWWLRAGVGGGYRWAIIDDDGRDGHMAYGMIGIGWAPGGQASAPAMVPATEPSPVPSTVPVTEPAPMTQSSTAASPASSVASDPVAPSRSSQAGTIVQPDSDMATRSPRSSTPSTSDESLASTSKPNRSGLREQSGFALGVRHLTVEAGENGDAVDGDEDIAGEYQELWIGWVDSQPYSQVQLAVGYGEADLDRIRRGNTLTNNYELAGLVFDVAYRRDLVAIWRRQLALDWELGAGLSLNAGGPNDDDSGLGIHARAGVGFDINFPGLGGRVGTAVSARYYEMTPDSAPIDSYDFIIAGLELSAELRF